MYVVNNKKKNQKGNYQKCEKKDRNQKTRGSQEPVIAHLVFNLTSKVDRKWGCCT